PFAPVSPRRPQRRALPPWRVPGMTPPPTSRLPRSVVTVCVGGRPRSDHEQASQAWVARRLAALAGWEYAGAFDPSNPPPLRPYFVPDETLTVEQAAGLGI